MPDSLETRQKKSQAARNRPRSHYERVSAALRRDPDECFAGKVIVDSSGCHLWQGTKNAKGYGLFTYRIGIGKRRTLMAHKYAWERKHGAVPDGLELDHLCRTRSCVNADHLEAVTHAVNVQRGELGATTRRRLALRRAMAN